MRKANFALGLEVLRASNELAAAGQYGLQGGDKGALCQERRLALGRFQNDFKRARPDNRRGAEHSGENIANDTMLFI